MIGPAIMYATSTALGFVIAVVVMLWLDWRLTLIALLPLPGVTLATRYFGQAIHDRFERIQAQLADMSAIAQEAFSGVRVVKAYGQEAVEIERFGRANDEYVERNQRLIQLQAAFYPSLTLCFGESGLLVLWFGGRSVVEGRLTLGEFVAFGRYLVLLGWPLIAFGWVINLAQRGMASWERMVEVLDVRPRADAPDAVIWPAGHLASGDIEARGLSFTYPGAHERTLDDISFTLPAGRTLAIVGATGSGKSTLVNLIPRLVEPPPGSLYVDGIDVGTWRAGDLRAAIAMVADEPFLFSDTIGGNIVFGLGDPWGTDRARAIATRAASLAGLDADLASFPAGLETIVGERGITLSGGQKQRVAIARALALDARILILDDALSAVDTATEELILRNLRNGRTSRTTVIVAHRVSTVRDADDILVLARGRLVERGTHAELVAAGGVYADMHQRQLLETELTGS
jgi:ATP-binding cassette subfamily B protein